MPMHSTTSNEKAELIKLLSKAGKKLDELITLDSRDEEIWCMAHLRFLHALLCGYVCDMTKMILGCDRIGWRMWRMWRCV